MSALELTGTQRKMLRGLAHGLKPVTWIGKGGLSEGLVAEIDQALDAHELIKVKFNDLKDEKKALSAELADQLNAGSAGVVGHILILYRPAKEMKERRIRLPHPPSEVHR
jgi:RNA-binding protein